MHWNKSKKRRTLILLVDFLMMKRTRIKVKRKVQTLLINGDNLMNYQSLACVENTDLTLELLGTMVYMPTDRRMQLMEHS